MSDTLNIFQRTNPFKYSLEYYGGSSGFDPCDLTPGLDTFLSADHTIITPNVHGVFQLDILVYLLLLFIGGTALLRWFMPNRFLYEFSVGNRLNFTRKQTSEVKAPGLVVDVFFMLNYLVTISLLTFLFFSHYLGYLVLVESGYILYVYIFGAYFLFWVYRQTLILLLSNVFQSGVMAEQQRHLDRNIENALGVLLLPLLVLALFSFQKVFILLAVFVVIGVQIFRWFQTIAIGISNTRFSVFHFILYLCALELIPIVVLIKLISLGNYF